MDFEKILLGLVRVSQGQQTDKDASARKSQTGWGQASGHMQF